MSAKLKDVRNASCAVHRISKQAIHAKMRIRQIARPRQIAMFVAREITRASYPQIGQFWNMDHTTVLSAVRRITKLIEDGDPQVTRRVAAVRELASYPRYRDISHTAGE